MYTDSILANFQHNTIGSARVDIQEKSCQLFRAFREALSGKKGLKE